MRALLTLNYESLPGKLASASEFTGQRLVIVAPRMREDLRAPTAF